MLVSTANTLAQEKPSFLNQPQDLVVFPSSNATLTVTLAGAEPISVQWHFNGEPLPGATNTSLTITNTQSTNEGAYSLAATNSFGWAISSSAQIRLFSLAEALGTTNLVLNDVGSAKWIPQPATTHDGIAAACAGLLSWPLGGSSRLQTSVRGPGLLTYWFKVDTLASMTVIIDGFLTNYPRSNPNGWNKAALYLGEGLHAITWSASVQNRYYAYLDDVAFMPGTFPIAIVGQPVSTTNIATTNVTLSVTVAGTPPISYQWYHDDREILGPAGSSLVISNVGPLDSGAYRVVASNAYGSQSSDTAFVEVVPMPPTFITNPVSFAALDGHKAHLSGAAKGSQTIGYQWLFNGAPIAGGTNSLLLIDPVGSASAGEYRLQASNYAGVSTSAVAVVTTYKIPDLSAALDNPGLTWTTPDIPWFPQSQTTRMGGSAAQSGLISGSESSTLETVVSGPATVTYWWKVDCNSTYVKLAFLQDGIEQASISGNIDWHSVTNYIPTGQHVLQWKLYPHRGYLAAGTAWLDQLSIKDGPQAPVITSPLANTYSPGAGSTMTLGVIAYGTPSLRYQWSYNDTPLPSATNSSLLLPNLQSDDAGTYRVLVTNEYGEASSTYTISVPASAPTITSAPVGGPAIINTTLLLSAKAQGSEPVSYRWELNGTPIPGAISNSLTIPRLQISDAGSYRIVAMNAQGSVTSSPALITVNPCLVSDWWPATGSRYSTPTNLGEITAIAVGLRHSVGLRPDGNVVTWGDAGQYITNVPTGLEDVTAIAAGDMHTLALLSNGTLVVWGDNAAGQLFMPDDLTNVTAIAAAGNLNLALKGDGTVVAWGENLNGQTNVPAGLNDVQSIWAGPQTGYAIKRDRTVVAWGGLRFGNGAGLPAAMKDVRAVAASTDEAWSLHDDGTLMVWASDSSFKEFYTNIAAMAGAGRLSISYSYVVVLEEGGTFSIKWKSPSSAPYDGSLPKPTHVIAVAAAEKHAAVLANDGSPRVVLPLTSQVAETGETVVFSSGVVGAPPLSYQWQHGATNIEGATNSMLVLTNVSFAQTGTYGCVVTNAMGSAATRSVQLDVQRSAPFFGAGTRLNDAAIVLHLEGLSGQGPIVVYSSTDLLNWTPVITNAPATGTVEIIVPTPNARAQFYRAREN